MAEGPSHVACSGRASPKTGAEAGHGTAESYLGRQSVDTLNEGSWVYPDAALLCCGVLEVRRKWGRA